MSEIDLGTVTRALSWATTYPADGFQHEVTYNGDADNGVLVVTWYDEDAADRVTFTVRVSDIEVENVYDFYEEDE